VTLTKGLGVAVLVLAAVPACSSSGTPGPSPSTTLSSGTAADEDGPYLAFYGAGIEGDASIEPADAAEPASGDAGPLDGALTQ
jgi:hypothetical protein